MFKFVALSSLSLVAAVPDVAALCTTLLDTNLCATAALTQWQTATATTAQQCMDAFAGTPQGADGDLTGDSIGCRQTYAAMVSNASNAHFCRYAGLSGGGQCGAPLATTCRAITNLCQAGSGGFASAAACSTNLTAYDKIWGSKQGVSGGSENSLECRIYHAVVGNQTDVQHCGHSFSNSAQCTAAVSTNADQYCVTINSACTAAAFKQYNNHMDCVLSFGLFPDGTAVDTNAANDRGCRQYHAQAANILGTGHCAHAGPSGGGVCGGTNSSRKSWEIMSGVCNTFSVGGVMPFSNQQAAITSAFGTWAPADFRTVVPNGTAGTYTTGNTGNTDLCRIYHGTVATQAPSHCNHASLLGGDNCGAIAANICLLIQTGCPTLYTGTTAMADCAAGFGALLLANKTGDPNSLVGTDDSVACRVYHGALALAKKQVSVMAASGDCTAARHDKYFNSTTAGCLAGPTIVAAPTSGAVVFAPALAGALVFLVW